MSLRVESCRARSPVYMPAQDGRAARRLTIGSMEEQGGLRDGRRRATVSCRLRCQANVAPLQEAGRSLLKQGYRDLTPSERRNRISQHIRHVEHRKLGAVLHGRHLARSRRGRGHMRRLAGRPAPAPVLSRPINITSPIHDPLHEHALRLTHASIPEPVALAQTVSQEDELAGGGGGRAAAVLHLSEPRRLFLAAAVCPLLSAGRTGP